VRYNFRSDRCPVKAGESRLWRSPQILQQDRSDIFVRQWRHIILQLCQGACPFRAEQIVPSRQNLTKLDCDRAKVLQEFNL